jgi:hypothetical protein
VVFSAPPGKSQDTPQLSYSWFLSYPFQSTLTSSLQQKEHGGSARRKAAMYTQDNINAHTDIHALNGTRTHDPSVWEDEDRAGCPLQLRNLKQNWDVSKKISLKFSNYEVRWKPV